MVAGKWMHELVFVTAENMGSLFVRYRPDDDVVVLLTLAELLPQGAGRDAAGQRGHR